MRRLFGVVLAGAFLLLPAFSQHSGLLAQTKQTMEGDLALWNVAIRPDKTADWDQFLGKLKEALSKAGTPEAKQQLAGWKIIKVAKPLPDGNIHYIHVINPVAGADYNLLQVMYAVFTDPTEQKALYDLYRGALAANLGIISGTVAFDLSK